MEVPKLVAPPGKGAFAAGVASGAPVPIPRPVTRFDLLKRGPNDGTVWEGPNEGANPVTIFSTHNEKDPNRHTQWADPSEKDPNPETRPVAQALPEMKVVERPKGNLTAEQAAEMLRMHGETEGLPTATSAADVKVQVSEALQPLMEKFDALIDVLAQQFGSKTAKKERKHVDRNDRPRGVRGRPRKGGRESLPVVGSGSEPVADPPAQPEAPEQPA